jgi:hypothetical protein
MLGRERAHQSLPDDAVDAISPNHHIELVTIAGSADEPMKAVPFEPDVVDPVCRQAHGTSPQGFL